MLAIADLRAQTVRNMDGEWRNDEGRLEDESIDCKFHTEIIQFSPEG